MTLVGTYSTTSRRFVVQLKCTGISAIDLEIMNFTLYRAKTQCHLLLNRQKRSAMVQVTVSCKYIITILARVIELN